MTHIDNITHLINTLPDTPGVYQYYDNAGKIIYIGKAKNLKKRVSSYFSKEHPVSGKTQVLVNKIHDIKYIVVDTELDALLLENNLIKKYQPRYNILLKDDKTYPWICIKKEPFPRVFSTRNLIKDGSLYFGPFASVKIMNAVLDLVKKLYKLRTCNLKLTAENIHAQKFKVCLEYHIGNCKGPCIAQETEQEYEQTINDIKEIIKGNIYSVTKEFRELLKKHIEQLEFEKAQVLKEKIDTLEKFQSKSTVVNPSVDNVEVFSIVSDSKTGFVNFLKVINGAIIQGHTLEIIKKLDESDEDILTIAIVELRERFSCDAKEVLVPFEINTAFPGVHFAIPQRGDKKQLLELSLRNAEYFKRDKLKQESLIDPERHSKRVLDQMKKDLRLQEPPRHIECFDNSNFQGAFPVAAMTVFRDAKPSKKEYRHYTIKTVEGPNDYASMEEVIYRRYKRVLDEVQTLPQLIVVDGGKGQLSSAIKSLEKLGLRGKVAVIGIAKRLEEIYFPNDSIPLYLDKRSETLKIIQQIRDEAHRFGITHHRSKREKGTIKTELTAIKGVSDKSAQKLLSHFKSVKNIKQASLDDVAQVVGKAIAGKVAVYFQKNT